jgi:transposase InsO family protein
MTTSRPLELLHMDLFGTVAYLSIEGSKYGLVIIDDFSSFTWVFFL